MMLVDKSEYEMYYTFYYDYCYVIWIYINHIPWSISSFNLYDNLSHTLLCYFSSPCLVLLLSILFICNLIMIYMFHTKPFQDCWY